MSLVEFLEKLNSEPDSVSFQETMQVIDTNYDFTPTAFVNGELANDAGDNNGSCKIFAFGKINKLNEEVTLACFGDFYRQDVLQNPEGSDHQNIRNFIKTGWQGVTFSGQALMPKA